MKEFAKLLVEGFDVPLEVLSLKAWGKKSCIEGLLVIILKPLLICRVESNSRTVIQLQQSTL